MDFPSEVSKRVTHQNRQIVASSFYEGDKESEKVAVRELLKTSDLQSKSATLDALHTDPTTLEQIAGHGGHYIVQVKENQQELTKDLGSKARRLKSLDKLNRAKFDVLASVVTTSETSVVSFWQLTIRRLTIKVSTNKNGALV